MDPNDRDFDPRADPPTSRADPCSADDPWQRVDDLFDRVLDLPPAERARFLADACAGDGALREAVDSLLAAADAAKGFLETPLEAVCEVPWDEVLTGPSEGVEAPDARRGPDRSGQRVGPYRLVRRIGRGGMATVYLAERADGLWDQQVALKVIRRGLDTADVVRRFLAERQILSSLEHPNVARLLDGGTTEDGMPYLVMELVEGTPITRFCESNALTIEQRLNLFCQAGRAVHYAHQNLVVHRDLKPSNILVDATGDVKLLDFGIAKLLDPAHAEERTKTGLQLLTPEYASPEQIRGEMITTASDIYQLGMLLCVLLSGRRPYEVRAISPARIEAEMATAELTRPSARVTEETARAVGIGVERLARRLEGDLDTIVLKALRSERRRRYESADAMVADVEQHLNGHPISAHPPSWRYRTGKLLRRRPWLAPASAAAVLALGGYLFTVVRHASELERERNAALVETIRTAEMRDYLVGLFDLANPFISGVSADSLSAREMLDWGALRLESELANQPVARAALTHTIGRTYAQLGMYDRGIELLEESLAQHRELEGDEGPQVARDLKELAEVYRQRDVDSAAALLERARRITAATLGSDHPFYAEVLTSLAGLDADGYTLDRASRAELHDSAVAILRAQPIPPRRQLAQALVRSAYGRPDAVERITEALNIERKLYGEQHPAVAATLNDLGLAVGNTDPERGDSLVAAALGIFDATLGRTHGTTLTAMNNLAAIRRDRGEWEGAAELYEDLVARRRTRAPPDAPPDRRLGLAYSLYGLGVTRLGQDRPEEAEPYLREALEILHASRGSADNRVLVTATRLGESLRLAGRLGDAEQTVSQARRWADSAGGVVAPAVRRGILQELVTLYTALGRSADREEAAQALAALAASG